MYIKRCSLLWQSCISHHVPSRRNRFSISLQQIEVSNAFSMVFWDWNFFWTQLHWISQAQNRIQYSICLWISWKFLRFCWNFWIFEFFGFFDKDWGNFKGVLLKGNMNCENVKVVSEILVLIEGFRWRFLRYIFDCNER